MSDVNLAFPWFADPRWQEQLVRAREDIGGDPVFTYQSAHDPWFSSSYYFETERGVVLLDTQLCKSSAVELWEQIQRTTSGKLLCIINTHAHPDHFWGNRFFREVAPHAPVITGANVLADMRATGAERVAVVPDSWGDEKIHDPKDLVYPHVTFDGRMRLTFDRLSLELWECGPAEAPVQLVGWIPEERLLIAADVVQNRMSYYVSERSLAPWYRLIEDLHALGPRRVLTGHMGGAGPEIMNETKQWFGALLGAMAREVPVGADPQDVAHLDDQAQARIVAAVREQLPDWWDAMMLSPDLSILEFSLQGLRSEVLGREYLDAAR